MTHASISEFLTELLRAKSGRLIALLLFATLASVAPARAQSPAIWQNTDTWKSVAIIGGSTAAGAYIGHKVAGSTGAYVGAAVGATAGYAIDRRRRQSQDYSNSDYPANNGPSNNGPYGDNGGYYGNGDPNQQDGGYYGGSPDGYPYPSQYQARSNYRQR